MVVSLVCSGMFWCVYVMGVLCYVIISAISKIHDTVIFYSFSHGIQKKQKDPMMMEATAHHSCAIYYSRGASRYRILHSWPCQEMFCAIFCLFCHLVRIC